MDKNKRVALIILFVIGIGICTWSIYNSVVSMTKNGDSSSAQQTNNDSNKNIQNTGKPVVIDDNGNGDDNDSDTNTDDSKKNNNGSGNTANNASEKYTSYTVGEGETLKDICKKYSDRCPAQVLTKAMLSANNLKSSSDVKAGMKLNIPERYISDSISYTVKSGDSLSSIASKFMKDVKPADAVKSIMKDNFLSSDAIKVGDQLFVASKDISASVTASDADKSDTSSASDEETTSTMSTLTNRIGVTSEYSVKEGDTLTSISKKYSETCPDKVAANIILKANGFTKSTDIKSGMKIKLPDKYLSGGEIYTVQSGDTLYGIAAKNMGDINSNEAVSILVEDNGIKDNTILTGQVLFIPSLKEQQ